MPVNKKVQNNFQCINPKLGGTDFMVYADLINFYFFLKHFSKSEKEVPSKVLFDLIRRIIIPDAGMPPVIIPDTIPTS